MSNSQITHALQELKIELTPDEIELLKNSSTYFYTEYLGCNPRETAIYIYFIFSDKYHSQDRDAIIKTWVADHLIMKDKLKILHENTTSPDEMRKQFNKIMSAVYFRKSLDSFINNNVSNIFPYTDDKLSNEIISVTKYIINEVERRSIPTKDHSNKDIFAGMLLALIIISYLIQTTSLNFEIFSMVACLSIYSRLETSKSSKILGAVIPAYNQICKKRENELLIPILHEIDNLFKTNDPIYFDNLTNILAYLSEHVIKNNSST